MRPSEENAIEALLAPGKVRTMLPAVDKPRRRLFAVVFAAVLVVLLVARFQSLFHADFMEQGDLALNAMQIRNAKHLAEIYGNYSRFEFNHPGPAFFYAYAAGEWLLCDLAGVVSSPGGAHLVVGLGLQVFFLTAALVVLASLLVRRAFLSLAILAAAAYFGVNREALVSIWPPHVLALPFFCFLAAGTAVAAGRLRHVALLVFAGGFLVHGHVSQPLFVGGLGLFAWGSGLWRCRQGGGSGGAGFWKTPRGLAAACAVMAAVFLLPIAIDVATMGGRGNVAAIIARADANAHRHLSVPQSLLFLVSYPVASREQDRLLTAMGPEARPFLRAHAWAIAGWLSVLTIPVLTALAVRRRLSDDERRFWVSAGSVLAIATGCCVVWGMAQSDGVRHYNGYFYHGLYGFALMLVVAWIARLAEPRWRRAGDAAVYVVAAAAAVYAFRSRPVSRAERGLSIRDGVAAALAEDADCRPKLLVFDYSDWNVAAAVGLELERRGYGFYTPPWWSFMFQNRHDSARLPGASDERFDVWWIAAKDRGGVPLNREQAIFREPAKAEPGHFRIDFGQGGNAFRYVVSGIEAGESTSGGVVNERRVRLRFAPVATVGDVRVVFDAESMGAAGGTMPADVFFNGEPLGRVAIAGRAEVSLVVPAGRWNAAPISTLELRFPEAVEHRTAVRPDYGAWLSWRIWSIRFAGQP